MTATIKMGNGSRHSNILDGSSIEIDFVYVKFDEIKASIKDAYDCFDFYRKAGQIVEKIIQESYGPDVFFKHDISGKTPLGEKGAMACKKSVHKEDGFTPEEYSALTLEPVPNQWYNNLICEGSNGKVVYHEQAGNISAMISGNSFCKREHLIKHVYTEVPIRVVVI